MRSDRLRLWATDPAGLDQPGATARVALLTDLGRALKDASGDACALAFWLRPQNVRALAARTKGPEDEADRVRRFARGTTAHFLPGNTPYLGVYTWAVSFLCGNRTALRLSSRTTDEEVKVWAAVQSLLAEHGASATASTEVIRCVSNDPQLGALSAVADVRLIWGANTTVQAVRGLPSAPSVRDLVFGERHSLAAFDARSVLDTGQEQVTRLATTVVRDVAWSLHQACTAPRSIVWAGSAEECAAADARFATVLELVDNPLLRALSQGGHLERLTWAQLSVVEGAARKYRPLSNGLTLLDGSAVPRPDRTWPAGLLEVRFVPNLAALAPALSPAHQTLAVSGFGPQDLEGLISALAPGTVRRIVPVGDSHRFDVVWDGYDLIDEMTSRVTVPGARVAKALRTAHRA